MAPRKKIVPKKAATKRKVGRPEHKPTDQDRASVKAMASYGVPEREICVVIGIDAKTLRKHYRDELDKAHIEANTKVAQSLYDQAVKSGNVSAAIWWTKARMGWKETARQELTGEDGGPVQVIDAALLTDLTDEELEILERASTKLSRSNSRSDQG